VIKRINNFIELAEQGKEHGYFVLAELEDVNYWHLNNFTVFLRSRKEHGYFVSANRILKSRELILKKKMST
jgi:hypothetical protein